MKIFNTLAACLLSLLLFSQSAADLNIPDPVKKSFSRKFPRAEYVSWNKIEDNYKVDCYYKNRGTYAEFKEDGTLIITITDLDLKTLYPPIQKHLDENYSKDKVILAEKATKADKQDYYYVQIERKNPDTKEKYIAELFFDKTGRIEQVKLPEDVNDMTIVGIDNPNSEIPAEVINSWQKRFPKAENIDWAKKENPSDTIDFNFIGTFVYREMPTNAEFLPDGTWIETKVNYKKNELYVPVVKYLDEQYGNFDYVDGLKVTRADRQDYYYVHLELKEKDREAPWKFELYFNKSGKIQKIDRPEYFRSQYLLTVDVPPDVAKKFNSRFSSAEDVTWERSEGKWVSSFYYRELPTTAEFSDSAQWIQTLVELDLKNLYTPLQRNLDKDYGQYQVTYAEKATRKDRKDYYYVELIGKKKTVSPHKLGLIFDKTGRLKEERMKN
jgi:hypothetical protein